MAVQPLRPAAQVRARRPRRLKPTDDDAIDLYGGEFGEIAEDYLGVACPPRESTYTGKARNGWVDLPDVQVTACTVVDENDVTVAVDEIDTARGRVQIAASGTVTATYTHGIGVAATDVDPAEADALYLSACALYVERMVTADGSGAGRDTLLTITDAGTTRYSTPNKAEGRPTGFLQVDNYLNALHSYRRRVF